jgi:formylglycine-generating enzyme required for sulfatase activity
MRAFRSSIGIFLCAWLCVAERTPAGAQAPLSAAQERDLQPGASFKECDVCPEMVAIPAGAFAMGSSQEETPRDGNEGPQHRVMIARNFALGKFEVTVDQFAAFVQGTGHDSGPACDVWRDGSFAERAGYSWRNPGFVQHGSHPLTCVSWDDATAYAAWLSRQTAKTYRLPTEAEWEYAARAGAATRFYFGDEIDAYCRYGNGADQAAWSEVPGAKRWTVLPCTDGYPYTSPVGSFTPNAFGLYDMLGNVFEWVEDCWNASYAGAPSDGSAWTAGDCATRVQRGGAWGYPPDYLRTAVRGRQGQGYRYVNAGIRIARTLEQ